MAAVLDVALPLVGRRGKARALDVDTAVALALLSALELDAEPDTVYILY